MNVKKLFYLSFIIVCFSFLNSNSLFFKSFFQPVFAQTSSDWYMAGANPQRTSYVSSNSTNVTQITGQLKPIWYRPLYPYVPAKVQPIVYENKVFVSSSNGLYAFNTDNGNIEWVFPTEMPLGQSPTIINGIVYVGGMDRNLYALTTNPTNLPTDSQTGYKINTPIKTFTAPDEGVDLAAGFETNPLVVNNLVIAGNRNGYLYALNASDLTLAWKFKTGGPIRFSAAYYNNVVYIASMDGYAYAVNILSGSQIWKSAKLPGAGFYSYWPVIYNNYVLLTGSHHYLFSEGVSDWGGGADTYQRLENTQLLNLGATVNQYLGPTVASPSEWPSGSTVVRADIAVNYFEKYPEKRRFFVLNQSDGKEYNFDLDNDGQRDYPPFVWYGTHSGTRYPPVIAPDGTVYIGNTYRQGDYISTGQVVGWKFNTGLTRILFANNYNNVDEPFQWSMGGSVVYTHQFYGSVGSSANTAASIGNEWVYYGYNENGLGGVAPNYSVQRQKPNSVYNGTLSAPIPYKGKVFILDDSSILAFGNTSNPATAPLPQANIVTVPSPKRAIAIETLKQKLEAEVLKFDVDNNGTLDHLRPGYHSNGLGDLNNSDNVHNPQVYMSHYFHNPADTFTTLLSAYPYLNSATQAKVDTFLQTEYVNYNPCSYSHIGWNTGSRREAYTELPEFNSTLSVFGKKTGDAQSYWDLPPQNYYALWKYALKYGGKNKALEILNNGSCRNRLSTPPSANNYEFLQLYPYILNDYINGYTGYIELVKLAGETPSTTTTNTLTTLKNIRSTTFTINKPTWPNAPIGQSQYKNILSASRNLIDLTPELADYLSGYNYGLMHQAVNTYNIDIPYWFVSKYDSTSGEGILQQLFDYQSLFQAKAWILNQSREELTKYLDVPAFERGDLYYLQNLVAAIEAPSDGSPTPTSGPTTIPSPTPTTNPCPLKPAGDINCDQKVNLLDLISIVTKYGTADSTNDVNGDGKVNMLDVSLVLRNFPGPVATSTPAPTSEPTATPTRTPTPTPTTSPASTPTPTPATGDITYGFDDINVSPYSPFNGTYDSGITFSNNVWCFDPSFGGLTNIAYMCSGTSQSFTLPAGKKLKSIRLTSPLTNCTYTITGGTNTSVTGTLTQGNSTLVTTSWTSSSPNITLTFSNGADTGIDDITYGD